jgi:outer membrane protein TolC
LAGDPGSDPALFGDALQGWQIGVEVQQPLGRRREKAGVRNAELKLSRAHAVLSEQHKQIAGQLRVAFTELDRAHQVTQSLAIGREAAHIRLRAELERHAAGDTHIERVLEAQTRAVAADTAYLRSLLDYNQAFIGVHAARGTLLEMLGVGFSETAADNGVQFTQQPCSIFATTTARGAAASQY